MALIFQSQFKSFRLKQYLLLTILSSCCFFGKAQKIDSIYVHLYTDSLKKGTYNYINIDGKLNNGRYIPLDSSDIIFIASDGKFSGNDLWIDQDFKKEKVNIKVVLRSDPQKSREFTMFIKKNPNPQDLQTLDELMGEMKNNKPSGKKKK